MGTTSKYGDLPKPLGVFDIKVTESMFYLYMPIVLSDRPHICAYDNRLDVFSPIIRKVYSDMRVNMKQSELEALNMYITAKHGYVGPGVPGNRPGWHSDGFMTEDINYIWCDNNPTIFNKTTFGLSMDDEFSLEQMEAQALPENNVTYPAFTLLKLNQYNIHRVPEITEPCMRTFVKISFSKDKYDLIGNTHNYELDYNWNMKPRLSTRNIPQSSIKK